MDNFLFQNFTRQSLSDIRGPVTLVSGKKRRLTLIECAGNDINAMIDVAKVADLVLLLVDASSNSILTEDRRGAGED